MDKYQPIRFVHTLSSLMHSTFFNLKKVQDVYDKYKDAESKVLSELHQIILMDKDGTCNLHEEIDNMNLKIAKLQKITVPGETTTLRMDNIDKQSAQFELDSPTIKAPKITVVKAPPVKHATMDQEQLQAKFLKIQENEGHASPKNVTKRKSSAMLMVAEEEAFDRKYTVIQRAINSRMQERQKSKLGSMNNSQSTSDLDSQIERDKALAKGIETLVSNPDHDLNEEQMLEKKLDALRSELKEYVIDELYKMKKVLRDSYDSEAQVLLKRITNIECEVKDSRAYITQLHSEFELHAQIQQRENSRSKSPTQSIVQASLMKSLESKFNQLTHVVEKLIDLNQMNQSKSGANS